VFQKDKLWGKRMPEIVYTSTFYENLIIPLENIEDFINQLIQSQKSSDEKNINKNFSDTRSMSHWLSNPDFKPFPHYQAIIEKLDIKYQMNSLSTYILLLNKPDKAKSFGLPNELTKEETFEYIKIILDNLNAHAHLLNCIELIHKAEIIKNKTVNTSFYWTYSCNGNSKLVKFKHESPKINIYTRFINIILNNIYNTEELQNLVIKIFSNFNPLALKSIYEEIDFNKTNIFDNKYTLQQFVIKVTNEYKKEYQSFLVDGIISKDNFSEKQSQCPSS
jgi:hypothetical protein